MNSLYKYVILYILLLISTISFYYSMDSLSNKSINLQKNILLTQAKIHFNNQINIRRWSAEYGGVYVKPKDGQKPNPYLKDNILKVDDNLTLLKINPAWMTRQLSELSQKTNIKKFHFRITSLIPINPENKATHFEKKALEYFKSSNEKEYYELTNNNTFKYMGALITIKSCLQCHKEQGHKVGDIVGGISINLDSSKYEMIKNSIQERALLIKILITIFLISTAFLIHRQIKHTKNLENEVQKRTKEIGTTKILLQKILDNDKSFVLVSDGINIIFANKTILDLANCSSLEEFKNKYKHISDNFEEVDDVNFLKTNNNGLRWIPYLQKEQHHKELKVLINYKGKKKYLKPYLKEINIDNQLLYLITFDDITKSFFKIKKLKVEASKDPLTKLFNRRKLDLILDKEMEISSETLSKLSIIFLDIDHFKVINDTFGHITGDKILIELSDLITKTMRTGDFISRWGGEEFMITLHATPINQALELAEKLRVTIEKFSFVDVKKMTASFGVTEYNFIEDKNSLIKRVDEALYEAKENGRNRVVVK